MKRQEVVAQVVSRLVGMARGSRLGIQVPRLSISDGNYLPKEHIKVVVERSSDSYTSAGCSGQHDANGMADWLLTSINGIMWSIGK